MSNRLKGHKKIKIMTTIYCLTEWYKEKQANSEMFMTLQGVANYLAKQSPINNKFNVTDKGIEGKYDINADNLANILASCKQHGMAASFTINQFVWEIETRFTLSTINVND